MGRYSTPINSLITRLAYHATAGQNPARLLDGFKIVQVPTKETEGKNDLPSIRIMVPDMQEHFSPARNVDGRIEIKIYVSTDRDKGLAALFQAVEKTLDAMDTDSNGTIRALDGIARHFDSNIKDAGGTDVSLIAPIILILQPKKHEVGKRS